MAHIGLRLALTICGVVEIVIPRIFTRHLEAHTLILVQYIANWRLRVDVGRRRCQFLLRRAKHGIINKVSPPCSPFLELPPEVRNRVYEWTCTPQPDSSVQGAHHLLHVNKQIYDEAKPFFDGIEHVVRIGNLERFEVGTREYMGLPQIVNCDGKLDWHFASLRHLALEVKVCKIGSMTPDCFDVYISHNGKEQWRNLKRLIGIWPHIREAPLESVRLDLSVSRYHSQRRTYRADLIRIIRNFKRTRVWAETGTCSQHKGNRSVLLPLVRAFNQGRRNWEKESNVENNLIVRYDKHVLSRKSVDTTNAKDDEEAQKKVEDERQKWNVQPTDDTSRSDNSVWPEWTGLEEKYIHDKMIRRSAADGGDQTYECHECLAVFDKPRELREHWVRGQMRS